MHPLVGFLITGVLPLVVVVATVAWFVRFARRNGSASRPIGVSDVPRRFWLAVLVEAVVLAALMIWAAQPST
jgi:hypothetical protein